jgi:predicted metalloendopeptidase
MRRLSYVLPILLALTLGAALVAAPRGARSFDPANMDTGVSPCQDFYQYAVGAWEQRTVIPPEYAKYGVDQEVEARTFALLKAILEDAAGDTSALKGLERQKVGDFFAAGMDEARIEEEGGRPLEPLLARISAVRNPETLATAIAFLQEIGSSAAFRLDVAPDDRNSSRNILEISQHGLGLPDRDYYLKQDAESKRLRQEYVAHAERMFGLLGDTVSNARQNAQTVMRVETRLARASMTRAETDDPIATYHKMSQGALAKHAAGFAWDAYSSGSRCSSENSVGWPGAFLLQTGGLTSAGTSSAARPAT